MATLSHYHKCIRKITSGFASLFNNILLIRENTDGTENQRFIVPLDYGDKEKYLKRLQGDPNLDKKTQITLPRMSYEMTGFRYDAGRKLNTNNKNFGTNPSNPDSAFYQFNPVPYDFDFSLTIYTRTIEDGNQIIEQILPYFTPDYTIKVNMVPDLNIVKNIPVLLNNTQPMVDSDGAFSTETRTIYWTLTFTVKGFIFGAIKDGSNGIIKSANTNFLETVNAYTCSGEGNGDFMQDETVYQGISLDNAYCSARVKIWDPLYKLLVVTDQFGSFKFNQPIIGSKSLAIQIPTAYSDKLNVVNVAVSVNPPTANIKSTWTANTNITEYGA